MAAKVVDIEAVPATGKGVEWPFGIQKDKLLAMNADKDMEALKSHGGAEGLAKALGSDIHTGLDSSASGAFSLKSRQHFFGKNELKQPDQKSFWALVYENLQDPVILLLIGAAALSTGLGAGIPEERANNAWIEGVAIWIAVALVAGVGAGNDYQKDKQFRKLNAQRDVIETKVIRNHQSMVVKNFELIVGDIVLLDTGDKIVADGVVIEQFGLILDEASLTGESEPIKKNADDPWLRSGTQVSEGSGRMLIVAVGAHSEWGKAMALMEEAGDDNTPLQDKLEDIAGAIGKVGFGVAIACFIAMLIKWCVVNKGFPIKQINNNGPVQFFLYAVTIIVVAVPEGLPLAVTISLAYSMKKMLRDNNFVRVLSACETMGGATAICSDKTGTLTENRMTVVEGWFAGTKYDKMPQADQLHPELFNTLKLNIALNSKAFVYDGANGRPEFAGNRTECALLMLLKGWGHDYKAIREEYADNVVQMYNFSSARKMASALIRFPDKYRLYNKGAAEWVLRRCKRVHSANGGIVDVTDDMQNKLTEVITDMAKRGLRCICLAYTDYSLNDPNRAAEFFEDVENVEHNLTAMAIVGIKDPVRPEVPDAVATCQRAGITVRMVTGDNIHTAQHIARECGILQSPEHVALEGPQFRAMPAPELQALLPNLRVLARSSPEDKLTLVQMLKQTGEVVAVTGDGTNDAPALKESDVGLAMGIAGTEVAKEAADIIILDDNFSSIVKSVLWGRSVFNNIQKFLQFQLTVNASALVVSFVGAVIGGHEPLNVLQLLWVNLIMDTMGALALATEQPSPQLLLQKPHGREEPLINKKMWKHIVIQALYQLFWMFVCLYGLPSIFSRYAITSQEDYYKFQCPQKLVDEYGYAMTSNSGGAVWFCNIMSYCGFPLGSDTRNSAACDLYPLWTPTAVSDSDVDAICNPPRNGTVAPNPSGTGCTLYDQFDTARSYMASQYTNQNEEDWDKPLSVLFNAFIMMQVANEICARRINDEYTIFTGIVSSPIFFSVIIITVALQAIIMNCLGLFFKVVPLDWKEWLATIAIGLGTIPLSYITRFVSRSLCFNSNKVASETSHERTSSGMRHSPGHGGQSRTLSGERHSHGTHSGRHTMAAVLRE